MNIKNYIQETIKDFEEKQVKLSILYSKCLRIAHQLNDKAYIFYFNINLTNAESQNNKLMIKEAITETKDEDEIKSLLNEYIKLRRVSIIKDFTNLDAGRKEGSLGFSISEIENQIDYYENNLKNNTIPDGLHSLDLYHKDNEKKKNDLIFNDNLNQYSNILSRLKQKAYQYLIQMEKKVEESKDNTQNEIQNNKNVFIIHGHDEAKWRELEKLLKEDFKLNPIVLQEQPNIGSQTIIEKFEHYAKDCCYALAIFTPDDIVENKGQKYFQARPNVIFELGWFCSFLGRRRICIVMQEGSNNDIFSDFQGVLQRRFNKNISEIIRDIKLELNDIGII